MGVDPEMTGVSRLRAAHSPRLDARIGRSDESALEEKRRFPD
jgi:hypothetical protein